MKNKKRIGIILAGLTVVLAVSGILFYRAGRPHKTDFTVLTLPENSSNYVGFKSNVFIAGDSSAIQKNYDSISVNNGEYTIVYKKELPDFFKERKAGEIFCVYPDSRAEESFFALGFCGKLKEIDKKSGKKSSVTFTVPELTDVFSDIYINTSLPDSIPVSAVFYPDENVTNASYTPKQKASYPLMCMAAAPPISLEDSLKIGSTTAGFKFKKSEEASLLDDYVLICDEMTLNIDKKSGSNGIFKIGGSITLEETAVKMLLDFHYDEASNSAIIKDYSLGFITKQKIGLHITAEQSMSLKDLNADLSEKVSIIDIEDVTDSEKGKIVLGTYVIGWDAALPVLQNDTNKINYLSLGLAVQLSVTGSGELSLEYNMEESGFAQIEVNGNGENKFLNKGYAYPNPVKDSRKPTKEEASSVPGVTSTICGNADFDMAFGADIGICILGMIPIKQTNNLLEFQMTKSFTLDGQENAEAEVLRNNYLLDNTVDSLILSTNSHLKMHLGAKINFGSLQYTIAEIGGSIQLFHEVWYQSPPAAGFSHSQCGFGGIFTGEKYSDDELEEAVRTYRKDTSQNSLFVSAKDMLLGSLINGAFNNLGIELLQITDYLDKDMEKYRFDYYTSGVLYVRDEEDRVAAIFVMGDDVANAAGVHNGLSSGKLEQIYSIPDSSAEIDMNIGLLAGKLLGMDWAKNAKLAESTYNSHDSSEQMHLIFYNDTLKMIIITA